MSGSLFGIFFPETAVINLLCTHLTKELQTLRGLNVWHSKATIERMEAADLGTHHRTSVAPEVIKQNSLSLAHLVQWMEVAVQKEGKG